MKLTLTEMMGHSSVDFTDLTRQNDDFGLVADYLDQALSEEDLYKSFVSKALVYGFIATNWDLEYRKTYHLVYEQYYVALVNAKPKTQADFDKVRSLLHGETDSEE